MLYLLMVYAKARREDFSPEAKRAVQTGKEERVMNEFSKALIESTTERASTRCSPSGLSACNRAACAPSSALAIRLSPKSRGRRQASHGLSAHAVMLH